MGSGPCHPGAKCLLLALLWSAARADVDIVVNLQGASLLVPSAVRLPELVALSQMDNSDLLVRPCAPGTFSPDHGGVCGPCVVCDNSTQYAAPLCLPYADAVCHNCTVCAALQAEYCRCSVLTPLCYTGNRVCMPVPPTALRLTLLIESSAPLTMFQERLVEAGFLTGYLDWLVLTFGLGDTTALDFRSLAPTRYTATFFFPRVYNATLLRQIRSGRADFYDDGVLYTFGARRRRLLQTSYSSRLFRVVDAFTNCTAIPDCTDNPFVAFVPDSWDNCTGACVPIDCPPGYTGDFGECSPCPNATYKDTPGNASCAPCPANYSSPQAATSVTDCAYYNGSWVRLSIDTTSAPPPGTTSAAPPGTTSAPPAGTTSAPPPGTTGLAPAVTTSALLAVTASAAPAPASTAGLTAPTRETTSAAQGTGGGAVLVAFYVTVVDGGHDPLTILTCVLAGLALLVVVAHCLMAWPSERSRWAPGPPVIPVNIERRRGAAQDLVLVRDL